MKYLISLSIFFFTNISLGNIWIFDQLELAMSKDDPKYLRRLNSHKVCIDVPQFSSEIALYKSMKEKESEFEWQLDTSGEYPTAIAKDKSGNVRRLMTIAGSKEDCVIASVYGALIVGVSTEALKAAIQ